MPAKPHSARAWVSRHKKQLLFGSGLMILLTLSIYSGYSVYQWRQYETTTQKSQENVRKQIQTTLASQDKLTTDKLGLLRDTIAMQTSTMCTPAWLVAWQATVVTYVKTQVAHCETSRAKLQAAQKAMDDILVRVQNEKGIGKALSEAKKQLDQTPQGDYAKMQSIWHSARQKISQTPVDTTLKETQQQTVAAIQEIETALGKLIEADKAQKRPEFDTALTEVEKAYGKLAGTQNTSSESFSRLAENLENTIKQ